ncbi:uncharacterized protein DSM5745_00077 [Aspergillus mulundensis]|uniref:F-box domain-containing protein n=1 Tax=Aspergillus mulundensis TaxID=1810919 RepID=A0A3D8T2G4_9EURO|nr:hypothetical protein DSM5745_00077 [Aspergillus mulundensis]RDW92755.1 hypothetical protein DSM5745_00077 [Aspergillus mulundensis]
MDTIRKIFAAKPKADPFAVLNYDCASIVLEHLGLWDLGNAQHVSSAWNELVQDWIASEGLHQHFPEAWSKEAAKPGWNRRGRTPQQRQEIVRLFNKLAIKKVADEAWKAGQPAWVTECIGDGQDTYAHGGPTAAGDYLAWADGESVFWKRAGYRLDENGIRAPYPAGKVDVKLDPKSSVEPFLRLHARGFLYLSHYTDEDTDHPRLWIRMFELETEKELWCKRLKPHSQPWFNNTFGLVAMGWDRMYCYSSSGKDLQVHDLRTCALLYKLRSFTPHHLAHGNGSARVWRLRGRDILVLVTAEINVRIIDAEDGRAIQTIRVAGEHRPRIVVSNRPGELAFAILGRASNALGQITDIPTSRPFQYNSATGKFVEGATQRLNFSALSIAGSHETVSYDPFRGIAAVVSPHKAAIRLIRFAPLGSPGADSPVVYATRPVSFKKGQAEILRRSIGQPYVSMASVDHGVGGLNFGGGIKFGASGNRLYVFCVGDFSGKCGPKKDPVCVLEFGPRGACDWPLQSGDEDSLHAPDRVD